MSLPATFMVSGSSGITPAVNTIPLTMIAWEYGPIAAGALDDETIDFSVTRFLLVFAKQ
jgi:hypothetical protein